ncbi:MAG: AbrB/MazE/SpoVT family DNA-binding domain-containing protein [Blastomonas sp.]
MGEEYIAKSFKSGNSVAIRMPAALGIEPGREWVVTVEGGEFVIRAKAKEAKKIDLTGIAGSIPWLKPLAPEDREIEARELDWEGKLLKRD